jgi:DnaJ-class molecular chaperone
VNALATQERPQTRQAEPQHLFEPAGSTLEDAILGAWEDLGLSGETDCPVCGDSLHQDGCAGCGSQLT